MSGKKVKGEELLIRLETGGRTICEGVSSELPYPFKIGRRETCFWSVPKDERSVSAEHAEVFLKRNVPYIRDIGSRNGLYVMGTRVAEQRLAPGTQVSMGECRLIVEKCRFSKSSRALPFHRLERLNGPQAGEFVELRQASVVIGSGIEDGILCADILVSKRHAEILRKPDDTCWIKDLGSRNGTQVNHLSLKEGVERMLRDQDVVSVADQEFRFWDRTIEHVRSRLWLKLGVALVTAAACGTLYFVWQSVCPSAKSILKRAQEQEYAGRFDEAAAILETARDARGFEYYADEVARKRGELAVWKSTVATWGRAKESIAVRGWISASKELGSLVDASMEKWGWNPTTAQAEKKKARTLKSIIDAFLDARGALEGNLPQSERGDLQGAMARRLADMESALSNPEWTADLPSGKLREDMEDQCSAFRGILADLTSIARIVDGIPVVNDEHPALRDVLSGTADFDRRISELKAIAVGADRREDVRREQAEKAGRRFVTSTVVKDRCERFVPPLEKLLSARSAFERNIRILLAGKGGDLSDELPLPSEQQCTFHPRFGEVKRALTLANATLCGPCRKTFQDQQSRLTSLGVGSGRLPPCVGPLLDESVMKRVLSCDSLRGKRPNMNRTELSGEYDRVVGLESFADYLRNIDGERELRAPEGTDRPAPLLVDARALFLQISRYKLYLAQPDPEFLAGYESPSGNVLRDMAAAAIDLDGKRELLVDIWWNDESPALRSRIIARGMALALDLGGKLGESAPEELKRDLKALGAKIAELKRKLDADPDSVTKLRPEILRTGLPGLNGINALWDQESRRGGSW